MTDNLPQGATSVNPEQHQIDACPPKEYAERLAQAHVATIQSYYPNLKGVDEHLQLAKALQAIAVVSFWWATGECACHACVARFVDNERFLDLAIRAEVLRVYGLSSLKMPHRPKART